MYFIQQSVKCPPTPTGGVDAWLNCDRSVNMNMVSTTPWGNRGFAEKRKKENEPPMPLQSCM